MKNYNKITILEKLNSLFICSNCCDSKSTQSLNPFHTSTASLFLEHQRCQHPAISEFDCIYCCCRVPTAIAVHHIQTHFLPNVDYRFECKYCTIKVSLDVSKTIDHIHKFHNSNIHCPHCNLSFTSTEEVKVHLLNNILVLFHCNSENCLVKTHSKELMLIHMRQKHNGARFFRIESQFLCSERGVHPSSGGERCTGCEATLVSLEMGSQQQPVSAEPTGGTAESTTQLIELPYSARVLTKLCRDLEPGLCSDLSTKMEQYSKFRVRLEQLVDGQKQFVCATCQYRSVHSLADVRKHILGCHCSVSTGYTRLCLRASRLDTNSLRLFSDRKLIGFANEKLKRGSGGLAADGCTGAADSCGDRLLDDSEPESPPMSAASAIGPGNGHPCDGPDGSEGGDNGTKVLLRKGTHKRHRGSDCSPNFPVKKQRLVNGSWCGGKQPQQKQLSHQTAVWTSSGKLRADSPVPEVGPPLLGRVEPVEREIPLSFSWPVLQLLVRDACPADYLPLLRAKMEAYVQHSILLARRAGRRFFLCSHCCNSSPHGMNDIRKHILGVHARLPERFKAAAMYCSRMNRDNYGLLSDQELLKKKRPVVLAPTPTSSPVSEDEGPPPLNFFLQASIAAAVAAVTSAGIPGEDHPQEDSSPRSAHNIFLANHPDSPPPSTSTSTPSPHLAAPANGRSRRSLILKSAKATTTHQYSPL